MFQMKNFYKFRAKNPKYLETVMPINIRHVFDTEIFVMLPTRTPQGSRILIVNAGGK